MEDTVKFPKDYRKHLTEKVLNLVQLQERILIENLPGCGGAAYWRYLGVLLENKYPDASVISIDLGVDQFSQEEFINYIDLQLGINSTGNKFLFIDNISKLLSKNQKLTIIFNITGAFENADNIPILKLIIALRNALRQRIIVILKRYWRPEGFYNEKYKEIFSNLPITNKIYEGPFIKDWDDLFAYMKLNRNIKIDNGIEKKLISFAGGIPTFAKQLYYFSLDNEYDLNKKSEREFLELAYKNKVSFPTIYHLFKCIGGDLTRALISLVIGNPVDKKHRTLLYNLDLISTDGVVYSKYLSFLLQQPKFRDSLLDSNQNNSQMFGLENLTGTESRIYNLFLENKGKVINRFEIAKAIWADDATSKYSDYTIDKHISNIRKKLRLAKSNIKIKTVHGRGFILAK